MKKVVKEEKKKRGINKPFIGALILVLIACALYFFRDSIPILRSSVLGMNEKWARMYYKELRSGEYKKEIDNFSNAKAKKISFIGAEDDIYPAMVIEFEIGKDKYQAVFFIANDRVNLRWMKVLENYKMYYDSVHEKFNYFYRYRGDKKFDIYNAMTYFTKYNRENETTYYAYDDGTSLLHESPKFHDKKYNQKINTLIVAVDAKDPVSFEFDFDEKDYIIKEKIIEAASNYKTIEELTNDDMIKDAKKKIEQNKKKSSSSSSKSSSLSSSSKKCENPCNCIERKKCPKGFTLMCSMEWCEKKDKSISKANCNDSVAKKYGTPAKGATTWSDYYNSCFVYVEATK